MADLVKEVLAALDNYDPHYPTFEGNLLCDLPQIAEAYGDEIYSSRAIVMRCFEEGYEQGGHLQDASQDLKADVDVVSMANEVCCDDVLEYAAGQLRDDYTLVLRIVAAKPQSLQHASERLRAEKQVVLAALESWTYRSKNIAFVRDFLNDVIASELLGDRDVLLACCANSKSVPVLFETQAPMIQDAEFAEQALSMNGQCLEHFPEPLRLNRKCALAAVSHYGRAIQWVGEALRGDKEVAIAAVQQCGAALQWIDPTLRDDREVVMAAVKWRGESVRGYNAPDWRNPHAPLQYASGELRSDKEICICAITHAKVNTLATWYSVAEELRADVDVAMALTSHQFDTLSFVPAVLLSETKLVRAALRSEGPRNFAALPSALRDDRQFCLDTVRENADTFAAMSPSMRADEEIAIEAASRSGQAFRHASAALRLTKAVVLPAVRNSAIVLCDARDFCSDREVVLAALRGSTCTVSAAIMIASFLSSNLKSDPEVLRALLSAGLSVATSSSKSWSRHMTPLINHVVSNAPSEEASELIAEVIADSHRKSPKEKSEPVCSPSALIEDLNAGWIGGVPPSVILVTADGAKLPAHREMLAMRSPVFNKMFTSMHSSQWKESSDNGPEVQLGEIEGVVLKELLRYVYTDQVSEAARASEPMARALLEAGSTYQMKGLLQIMEPILLGAINVENAAAMLVLADRYSVEGAVYSLDEMKAAVLEFVCQHWPVVKSSIGAKEVQLTLNAALMEEICDHFGEHVDLPRKRQKKNS